MGAPTRHADGTLAGSGRPSDSEAGPLLPGDEVDSETHLAPRTLRLLLSKCHRKRIYKPTRDGNTKAGPPRGHLPLRGPARPRDAAWKTDVDAQRHPPRSPAGARGPGWGLQVTRRPVPLLFNSSSLQWCPRPLWTDLENRVRRFGGASGRPGRGSAIING